jgi:hypothetical protein
MVRCSRKVTNWPLCALPPTRAGFGLSSPSLGAETSSGVRTALTRLLDRTCERLQSEPVLLRSLWNHLKRGRLRESSSSRLNRPNHRRGCERVWAVPSEGIISGLGEETPNAVDRGVYSGNGSDANAHSLIFSIPPLKLGCDLAVGRGAQSWRNSDMAIGPLDWRRSPIPIRDAWCRDGGYIAGCQPDGCQW